MAAGASPADALEQLVAEDDQRDYRQVAFLAADGRTAAHVGEACIPEVGAIPAENVSVQGNMLRSPGVVPAMGESFASSQGTLAERLLDALDAADSGSFQPASSSASRSRIGLCPRRSISPATTRPTGSSPAIRSRS
jgi:uncharacterized Ntn-hydrolase superfamily protein